MMDIRDFIQRLRGERKRCFIVYGDPMTGKSRFARKMCDHLGAVYINLLNEFAADAWLKAHIDTFTPEQLKGYLIAHPACGQLAVVDDMDFLWFTWPERDRRKFLNMVAQLSRELHPDGTPDRFLHTFFGFFLQSDYLVRTAHILDQDGRSRVVSLSELYNLP